MIQSGFVLIAEDDVDMAALLVEIVEECGFYAQSVSKGDEAQRQLEKGEVDILFTDLRIPAPDGLELLYLANHINANIPVVMITGQATIKTAIDAFRLGAFDLITKPFETEQIRAVLRRLRTLIDHRNRIDALSKRLDQIDTSVSKPIIKSKAMSKIMQMAHKVAPLDVLVLLIGETGTGKGVMAKILHQISKRNKEDFFSINCAAVASSLIESELFGYEKGAFTGATQSKKGLLELANGGTLFLDEINSAEAKIQSQLLHFIQERQIIRVGGTRHIDIDVRLICAGNQPLEQLVKEGSFREDLYYRLMVYPLNLPPLRERIEDIIPLAEEFLLKFSHHMSKNNIHFSEQAIHLLLSYHWPGNIRELENIIQRAVILAPGDFIESEHLPNDIREETMTKTSASQKNQPWSIPSGTSLLELETYWINQVLQSCSGNKTQAAQQLGINTSTLYRKLK